MKTIVTIVITLVAGLAVLCLAAYGYLKTHTFEARQKPSALEVALVKRVHSISTPRQYSDMTNPVPATAENIAEGMHHYATMCVVCHGKDGSGHTETAGGLYPPVPDLRSKDTQRMSDGTLYNVIKNGIRFSGMPAWDEKEPTYWMLVAFVRHLPSIIRVRSNKSKK